MYEILSSYIFKWHHLMFEMHRTCRRFDQTPCFANCTFQTRESPQNRVHASWPILKCNVCFQLSRGLIGILKRQCSCRKRLLSARRGYFVPGRTMVENKVQDGAFAAIEDITIIPSILGYSTPHSRVLQKTHKNYDLSVQGVKKRLASASPCASTDPTMMSLIPKQRGVKCRMEFALQKMFRI